MPTIYVADQLHEYKPEKHQDILQLVPKYEYDEAQEEIKALKAQLKEHEDKGLLIYGRKIDVLNGTVRVLEAKLAKAVEQRNDLYERIENFDDTERNKLIKMCDDEINSITLESLKIDNARASAKNQMELSKVLDDNEDR